MSYTEFKRGFLIRYGTSKDGSDGFARLDADVLTEHGWLSASCLALDEETRDRELNKKLDELIEQGVKPGPKEDWQAT